ncbi:acetyl-CoA carboxylase biotin carboxyl carrier protein [Alteribacillus sp. HJP-4]|uniref:acetyl-CoA carboxylase biotin carboxyl carrier protein n=1 Tax=Alteribacillus sp. HJP-4 TaxID=2775394 RepID=UPI0035CD0D00
MYKVSEIKELIRALDRSSVGEIEIRGENKTKLTLRKESVAQAVSTADTAAPAPAAAPPQPAPQAQPQTPAPSDSREQESAKAAPEDKETDRQDDTLHKITSPMVGTFYRSPSPDADPYVTQGKKISEDSVVCIVEAMKLMNELEAEVTGEIVEILVEDGELVEYGQPLFLVKAS